MKRSRGRYTEKEVQRCAEMGGSFGKDIDKILNHAGVLSFTESSSSRAGFKKRQQEDIMAFVNQFNADKLFSFVPNRSHVGLEAFQYINKIKQPLKLGKKLRVLSEVLDDWDVFCGLQPVL